MKVLIVYANFNKKGLCHQLLEKTKSLCEKYGHEWRVRDLYEIDFNPILDHRQLKQMGENGEVDPDVLVEQSHILWSEMFIFIYPIWWWERPAILKGWFDRVFTPNFAFSYDKNGKQKLLKGRQALVLQTASNRENHYQLTDGELCIQKNMSEGTLDFCGISPTFFLSCYGLYQNNDNLIETHLQAAHSFLCKHLISTN